MSTNRKALKILSLIIVLIGIAATVAGVMGITTQSLPGFDASNVIPYSAVGIASGIVEILVGVFGIRGANSPAKVGTVWTWSLIALVCSVIHTALAFTAAGLSGQDLAQVVYIVVLFVFANNVKKEAADRL